MIDPCPSAQELSSLLLGQLPPERTNDLEAHLKTCPQCQATMQSVDLSANRLPASLSQSVDENAAPDPSRKGGPQHVPSAAPDANNTVSTIGVRGMLASLDPALLQAEPLPPEHIREYRVLAKLGEGGMGAVYKAEHTRLRRIVALKILPSHRRKSSSAVARFDREMQAVGALDHPNIVRAYDAGEHEGRHYLVMEYVDGSDVSQLVLRHGPLPVAEACEIVRQAAAGLQHAHEAKLVHRDLKPSNLMLSRGGRVKILDLGLALLSQQCDSSDELTDTGQVMGTIDYMAPEQGGDTHKVDVRADIYSLGATLYKLLTGKAPFADSRYDTPMQKIVTISTTTALPLNQRRSDVPEKLANLVQRMLAKMPDDRPATPLEVQQALAPFAKGADLRRLASVSSPGGPLERDVTVSPSDETLAREMTEDEPVSPEIITGSYSTESQSAVTLPADNLAKAGQSPPASKSRVLLVGLGFLAVVLLGVVVYWVTDNGVVRVLINDASVSAKIDEGRLLIQQENKEPISVRAGKHKLHVLVDGVELETPEFALRRGDKLLLEVSREPDKLLVRANGDELARRRLAGTPAQSDWQSLFDGKSLAGWTAINESRPNQPAVVPKTWKVEGGAIVGQGDGTFIATEFAYDNFELELEWRLAERGNGGVFYRWDGRIREGDNLVPIAPEYQIVDDQLHSDGRVPEFRTASMYAVYPPDHDAGKPAGEWNATRIIVVGNRVQHWLNGQKVLSCTLGSEDFKRRMAKAVEQKRVPAFGPAAGGRIALQSHAKEIAYRNLRIRRVPAESESQAKDPDRAIARWIVEELSEGSEVGIRFADGKTKILDSKTRGGLPDEPFHVTAMLLSNVNGERDLSRVRGLSQLTELEVGQSRLRGTGLADLPRLEVLEFFNMGDNVDDDCLKEIGRLTSLKHLALNDVKATDDGLQHLRTLANLENLDLLSTGVTGEGLMHLAGLPKLSGLFLTGDEFRDAGLDFLEELPGLTKLHIGYENAPSRIGDEGVPLLARLQSLQELEVMFTKLSTTGAEELAGKLPRCKLIAAKRTFKPTSTAAPAVDNDRRAIRCVLRRGGLVTVWSGDKETDYITSAADLPAGDSRLRTLHLTSSDIPAVFLKQLSALTALRTISLPNCTSITPESLGSLRDCPELSFLNLDGVDTLTDDDVVRLAEVPKLNMLYVNDIPNLTDRSVDALRRHDMQVVSLVGSKATSKLIATSCADWPHLLILGLPATACTDDALGQLKQLHELEDVRLTDSPFQDSQLPHLLAIENLKRLNLAGTKLTNAGLQQLQANKKLRQLNVRNTQVTSEGIAEFRQARPECELLWEPPLDPASADPDRAAALWLQSVDGRASIGGLGTYATAAVKPGQELPKEPFKLAEVTLNRHDGLSDDGFGRLSGLKSLRALRLNGVRPIIGNGFRGLRGLPDLTDLSFNEVDLTDRACREIAALTQVDTMSMSRCRVSDRGLTTLTALRKMRNLYLYYMPGTQGLIDAVAGFPELRNLYLWGAGPELTDERVARLAALQHLELLDLSGTGVTGPGLASFAKHPLGILRLDDCPVDDNSLSSVLPIKSIRSLGLSGTRLSDDGIEQLAALTNLTEVNLLKTSISNEAAQRLHAKLPKCKLILDSGELKPQ
jgi:serine/threonine protein kinase